RADEERKSLSAVSRFSGDLRHHERAYRTGASRCPAAAGARVPAEAHRLRHRHRLGKARGRANEMNLYDLEPAAQRRASEKRLLGYLTKYVAPYHPFLRKLYRESGIDASRIRTIEEFRRLPIIDKKHLQ